MPYTLTSYGNSDIGLVRQNNEDVWEELKEFNFFVLADGMGGHQAGEIAAETAVSTLCQLIKRAFSKRRKKKSLAEARELIVRAIQETNIIVYRKSQENDDYYGMGTTLCMLYFHEDGVIFGHAGDSRIYRLRNNNIEQLTRDDSLVMELLDRGEIQEREVEDFAQKNIITKSIGTEPFVDPTVEFDDVKVGDIYLMCSDGLTDLLKADEIKKIIKESKNLKEASNKLLEESLNRGGTDNITTLLIKVEER